MQPRPSMLSIIYKKNIKIGVKRPASGVPDALTPDRTD